jgi:hypothetical protein
MIVPIKISLFFFSLETRHSVDWMNDGFAQIERNSSKHSIGFPFFFFEVLMMTRKDVYYYFFSFQMS